MEMRKYDRESIIRDLQERANGASDGAWMTIRCDMAREIVGLLKVREEAVLPVKKTEDQRTFEEWLHIPAPDFWCGSCGFALFDHPKYCQNCGKKVKWE